MISILRKLPTAPSRLLQYIALLHRTAHMTQVIRDEVEALKSGLKVRPELVEEFELWKATTPIPDEPLVTVCVATYNRPHLLVTRCLTSILAQTYKKLQILVIGDGCGVETQRAVETIDDPRITFFNLPERGHYPRSANRRWMVAGTAPANEGLRRATGDYITHLDDDDEYLPHRIERLVVFARDTKADFIWHPFFWESDNGWFVHPCDELFFGSVTTSSVFYRCWFKKIEWDLDAHMWLEPGDWNRFRRIKFFQPLMLRYPEPLLRHYREHTAKAA